MTEKEYRKLVMDEFDRQGEKRQLEPNLVDPTRRSIKDECENVCAERFLAKDEPVLTAFFGKKENVAAYVQAIQRSSADDFRTLHYFINDRSINTSFKNIRLLAWLIDFEPRPYHPDLKIPVASKPGVQNLQPAAPIDTIMPSEDTGHVNKTSASQVRWYWYALIVFLIAVMAGTYLLWRKRIVDPDKKHIKLSKTIKCMYWTGEAYQEGPCGVKHGDTPVVAFDSVKMACLKKMDKQAITKSSIHKAGYIKIHGSIEFFTDTGTYPLDTNRRLLPLSHYMYNKYVAGKP